MKIRKAICLLLAAVTLSVPAASAVPVRDGSFSDVNSDDWFAEDVAFVSKNNLMLGTEDGKFTPEGDMTRAMFMTVLWRADGEKAAAAESPFLDLNEDWYRDAVAWGYEKRIARGKSESSFAPDEPLTREELVAFIYRYAVWRGDKWDEDYISASSVGFNDSSSVSPYARVALGWATHIGIIYGERKADGYYFAPDRNVSRAETAAIINRFLTPENESSESAVNGLAVRCNYSGLGNHIVDSRYSAHSVSDVEKILTERRLDLYCSGTPIQAGGVSPVDVLRGYKDGFFENSSLFVAFLSTPSGSDSYSLKDLKKKGSVYTVTLDAEIPEVGTDDMAEWCMIIEIPKKDVLSSNVNLNIEKATGSHNPEKGSVITDAGIKTSVHAWIDKSLTYGNYDPSERRYFLVFLEREDRTGEPLPDGISVSVRIDGREYPLDIWSESNDERRFRLPAGLIPKSGFTEGEVISGTILFSYGEGRETQNFSTVVEVTS